MKTSIYKTFTKRFDFCWLPSSQKVRLQGMQVLAPNITFCKFTHFRDGYRKVKGPLVAGTEIHLSLKSLEKYGRSYPHLQSRVWDRL